MSGAFGYTVKSGAGGTNPVDIVAGPYASDILTFNASATVRTSTETRGQNAAFHPRIGL